MRRFSILLLPIALVACQREQRAQVAGGWVRLAAAPGRPAAGYFTVNGGPQDVTLTAVASPAVRRIELHESMKMGGDMGAMTMRPLASVAVPAGQAIRFAPGGKHLMLFDVAPTVKPGGQLKLTFRFADGSSRDLDARVVAAGDPEPS